jgi:hypothetical protein
MKSQATKMGIRMNKTSRMIPMNQGPGHVRWRRCQAVLARAVSRSTGFRRNGTLPRCVTPENGIRAEHGSLHPERSVTYSETAGSRCFGRYGRGPEAAAVGKAQARRRSRLSRIGTRLFPFSEKQRLYSVVIIG